MGILVNVICPISLAASLYMCLKYINLKKNLENQTTKTINFFLDKKLITKLIEILSSDNNFEKTERIMDEVLSYFCLDLVALKLENEEQIFFFRNLDSPKYYTETEISTLYNATSFSCNEGIISSKVIKNQMNRHVVSFKHSNLVMLVIAENHHFLSTQEIDTMKNEIMLLIKLSLFSKKNAF